MALITQADLEERVSTAEVARYSFGSSTKITDAIAEAEDKARSAALNVFTSESWDAMTAGTLPKEARQHIVSDAVDLLSTNLSRSDDIEKKATAAAQWRGWLAGDKVRCFDAILVKLDDGVSAVSSKSRKRVFDETDARSDYMLHNPRLP